MDYAGLISAVQAEVEGNEDDVYELTDYIVAAKIQLVESRLNRKLRLREMEQQDTTSYTSENTARRISVPDRFLELLTFEFKPALQADSEYKPLVYVAPQRISTYYQRSIGWYTTRVDFELNSVADQDYTLKLHYLKSWNVATDDGNWLLENYSDAYYYGALLKCRLYFKDKSCLMEYQAYFDAAIDDLNDLDARGRDDSALETDHVPTAPYYYNALTDR